MVSWTQNAGDLVALTQNVGREIPRSTAISVKHCQVKAAHDLHTYWGSGSMHTCTGTEILHNRPTPYGPRPGSGCTCGVCLDAQTYPQTFAAKPVERDYEALSRVPVANLSDESLVALIDYLWDNR